MIIPILVISQCKLVFRPCLHQLLITNKILSYKTRILALNQTRFTQKELQFYMEGEGRGWGGSRKWSLMFKHGEHDSMK